jgi:hypothetical protein
MGNKQKILAPIHPFIYQSNHLNQGGYASFLVITDSANLSAGSVAYQQGAQENAQGTAGKPGDHRSPHRGTNARSLWLNDGSIGNPGHL